MWIYPACLLSSPTNMMTTGGAVIELWAFSIFSWARTVCGHVQSFVCSDSEELPRRSCWLIWIFVESLLYVLRCLSWDFSSYLLVRQTDFPKFDADAAKWVFWSVARFLPAFAGCKRTYLNGMWTVSNTFLVRGVILILLAFNCWYFVGGPCGHSHLCILVGVCLA